MAFKMNKGSSPNFKDLGSSALPKREKSLGTRTDYTGQEDKEVNTLTKTNKRTGKVGKTKDISQRRADRISNRQNRKKMAPQARADNRAARDPNETDEEIQARLERDFPPDFGKENYDGPSYDELKARHKITDRTQLNTTKNKMSAEEMAKLKAEIETETLGHTLD